MSTNMLLTHLAFASFILPAWTHGTVSGIVAGGQWYRGYSPSFQWSNPPPVVAGWSIPKDLDNGFINDYTSQDINCHREATPGGAYVKLAAGGTVELQWTPWPSSHLGPVIDYIAPCNGDCTSFDKTTALWTKIDEMGLLGVKPFPGVWAVSNLLANNNSWVVTIPPSIAPGRYVLRHEILALHEGNRLGGAQNYPQCIDLEISGSGTNNLASSGTLGTKLYTQSDPGILFNIYGSDYSSYPIPGPRPLGFDGSQPSSVIVPSVPASSVVATSRPTAVATNANQRTTMKVQTTTKASVPVVLPTLLPTGAVLFRGTLDGLTPTKFACYAEL